MADHFVLLTNQLLTESTLETVINSQNLLQQPISSAGENIMTNFEFHMMDIDVELPARKMVECRICHDEDENSNMEIPCSCCGSLKYAHRRCVQRWCDEKGDTTCEICHQQFKPGYTAPSPLFHYGGIPINFRQNWEFPRRDLHNSRFLTMVSTEFEPDLDDYQAPTFINLKCCRIFAITIMILLVSCHTLPLSIREYEKHSVTFAMLLILRIIGILLPSYIMVRALSSAIQRWGCEVDSCDTSPATSDDEIEFPWHQPQQHTINL